MCWDDWFSQPDLYLYAYLHAYFFRSLCAIGKGCKRLKSLTLNDCTFLSDKGLEAVAVGCTGLTHLEVNGCHNIGTYGLESIARSCTYAFHLVLYFEFLFNLYVEF